ncbi:DNA-binding transcriptional regulator [soil metagenome]
MSHGHPIRPSSEPAELAARRRREGKRVGQRHVALIIETSKVYGREILLGISRYQQIHGPWSVYTRERSQNEPDPPWLDSWQGDGIITRSTDLTVCQKAYARGIPVVSLRHLQEPPVLPTVFPDQELIAQRVAEHLLERGFRSFGYCGVPDNRGWELRRREAFATLLERRGASLIEYKPTYVADSDQNWEREQSRMVRWLNKLEKPAGIMASHDSQGVLVLDACRRAGIRVPDEVGVVSVDNDPVLCDLASPPLSSLDQNVTKLGYEAASLLDRMMGGEKIETRNYFFEPGEVVTRQSSDVIAVDDRHVAAALRFIRENACAGIDVHAIARASGQSRRALEKKFTTYLGKTPMDQVNEIRLRRIKKLLIETDFLLSDIASRVGFEYHEYMSRYFRKHTGMAPGQFRRANRTNG